MQRTGCEFKRQNINGISESIQHYRYAALIILSTQTIICNNRSFTMLVTMCMKVSN